jgi:ABC-type glycerol-3-phosphate transport system permease component
MAVNKYIKPFILHALLILMVLISLYPMFIMLAGALKSSGEFSSNAAGLPIKVTFQNFRDLFGYNGGSIVRTYLNSVFISTTYTLVTLLFATMAAYAFSKLDFRGRNILFFMLLATMMIPVELNMTPMYLMFSKIHWLNTYQVQIIPGTANVFALFLLRQHVDNIPNELIEAARIDGAGNLRVYRSIIIPTSMPAISALGILVFLGKWNDYLFPKIMIDQTNVMPIMEILPTLNIKGSDEAMPFVLVLAGCTIVVVPLLIVFFIFQDKFMASVTLGAVKG